MLFSAQKLIVNLKIIQVVFGIKVQAVTISYGILGLRFLELELNSYSYALLKGRQQTPLLESESVKFTKNVIDF